MIRGFLGNLVERGWLPVGTDLHALAIQWMVAPLGLVYGDLDPALSVDAGLPRHLRRHRRRERPLGLEDVAEEVDADPLGPEPVDGRLDLRGIPVELADDPAGHSVSRPDGCRG